jgi:hypothetical protein
VLNIDQYFPLKLLLRYIITIIIIVIINSIYCLVEYFPFRSFILELGDDFFVFTCTTEFSLVGPDCQVIFPYGPDNQGTTAYGSN